MLGTDGTNITGFSPDSLPHLLVLSLKISILLLSIAKYGLILRKPALLADSVKTGNNGFKGGTPLGFWKLVVLRVITNIALL